MLLSASSLSTHTLIEFYVSFIALFIRQCCLATATHTANSSMNLAIADIARILLLLLSHSSSQFFCYRHGTFFVLLQYIRLRYTLSLHAELSTFLTILSHWTCCFTFFTHARRALLIYLLQ